MRRAAWIYVIGVLISAVTLTVAALITRPLTPPSLWLFLVLTLVTALMRVFAIEAPGHRAFEGSTIGFVAAVFLLPLWLFVALVIIAHAIEWVWFRLRYPSGAHLRAWYIQPFNMAKCIIGGSVANSLVLHLPPLAAEPLSIAGLLAVLLVVGTYISVNQGLLGLALSLARGISFRQAGIFSDAILIEAPLAFIGYVAVELTERDPLAALFVLGPIMLIYQAFKLPVVQGEAMEALRKVNQQLASANQSIQELNDELFLTLAKVFDARDPYVGGHVAQVAAYAVAIATEMGLPAERITTLRQAAYLHDIGKIAVPEVILHKSGALTPAEYGFLKQQTNIGADFVATSHGLRHLAPFIRHHHERWDGRGYPMGLAGEMIPLEARILNLCDSVEAMAPDRPYHRALPADKILEEIRRCSGTQFDPEVAAVFIRVAEREGQQLIANSARAVTAHITDAESVPEDMAAELFSRVYRQYEKVVETDPPPGPVTPEEG